MTINDVVVVTTTFSSSVEDPRAQLAIKTCEAVQENGLHMIVVDGGTDEDFRQRLANTGAKVLPQTRPGMGASRRQAIGAGLETDAEAICWIEPEKHPLIPFLWSCIKPVLSCEADVVLPRRTSMRGYPPYQAQSERIGNEAIAKLTGRPDLDFFFGPRILSRTAAMVMAGYDGNCGQNRYGDNWEILFVPVLNLLHFGSTILSVPVDYVHPPEQSGEDGVEMRAKRDTQRQVLVSCMTQEVHRLGFAKPVAHPA